MKLSTSVGENFSQMYPEMNMEILRHGVFEPSRYGDTLELLNYKTGFSNPIKRCVGGQRRDVNIFFLLAEAMWIWAGRRDVKFLTIFNSRMSEFSDDGETFHAPYGFRLRNWGEDAERSLELPSGGVAKDQLAKAIGLLWASNESRRVVLSIWNPDFDLFNEKPTKDTPCNDLLMFKIRQNKLHLSVANRSNDLHWGLPTNVFQFSFILEIVAKILGVEVGSQVHNSDSLHVYVNNDNNKIHETMRNEFMSLNQTTLYDMCVPSEMDLPVRKDLTIGVRLKRVDDMINGIINQLTSFNENVQPEHNIIKSAYFTYVTHLLSIYIVYTKTKRNDEARLKAIFEICKLQISAPEQCHDYTLLALNWFHNRLKDEESVQASMSEILMLRLIPALSYIDYSKVGTL